MFEGLASIVLESSVHTKVGIRLLVASTELVIFAAGLGLAVHFFRVKSPRLLSCLWGLVLLKPLLTLAIGSPIVLARFEVNPVPPPRPGVETQISDVNAGERDRIDFLWTVAALEPSPGRGVRGKALFSIPLDPAWFLTGLSAIWIGGICIGGVRWALAGYRLDRIVGRGFYPPPTFRRIYDEATAERGLKRAPNLLVSAEIESPVIFGAFRPVILFPAWLVDRDEKMLKQLFSHELSHYLHRDALILALGQLSLVLFFFHPVAHWAYLQWMWSAELACDRAVVHSEQEARDYAKSLITVLEGMQSRQAALSGLYATRHQLGSRLDALLDDPMATSPRLTGFGRSLVFLFFLFMLFFGFGSQTDAGDDLGLKGSLNRSDDLSFPSGAP